MDLWSLGMLSFFLFFWNKWFISVKSEHWELRSVLMFQIKDGMVFGVLECFFGCWIAANLCFKWRSVCLCEFSCEIEFFFDVWHVFFLLWCGDLSVLVKICAFVDLKTLMVWYVFYYKLNDVLLCLILILMLFVMWNL